MDKEKQLLACQLCERETAVLISINVANDSGLFGYAHQGICVNCSKSPTLEADFKKKSRAFIKANIERAKDSADHWTKELKRLEKHQTGEGLK